MKKTDEKVINFIKNNYLIEKGDKIVVALSGGADSVFLLHFLVKYQKKYNIQISVLHVNHQLRGDDADNDEMFCFELCKKMGIGFNSVKINVKEYSIKEKRSIEEAARDLRYNEFIKEKEKLGFNKVATAHNLDDNAETILQRLIEGTGLKGLCGIPVKRDNIYIRPVLCLTKSEIVNYLNYYNINFRIDLTNNKNDYTRNYLRNEIIPLISKLNVSFANSISHTSQIFSGFYSVILEKVNYLTDKNINFTTGKLFISNELFRLENDSICGEVLKLAFEKYLNYNFEYDDFINIKKITGLQVGKIIKLKGAFEVIKERENIVIYKFFEAEKTEKIIKIGELFNFEDKILKLELVEKSSINIEKNDLYEYISADNCDEEFFVRVWKEGDSFIPLGLNSFKKLSDFLTEQKCSSLDKKKQLLLINRNNITYVIGLRIDERYKITNKTQKVLKIWIN
ncbi:MAG: tRNA lysidine(34) synthetase TilS [bacterium]